MTHGMADGGGHGGSSTAEINVPCVIIGDQAISSDQEWDQILQVDIASTLALLTGVDIPSQSVGALMESVVTKYTKSDQLEILKHNVIQLQRVTRHVGVSTTGDDFVEAAFGIDASDDDGVTRARQLCGEASDIFQQVLVNQSSNYDMYQIIAAIFTMILLFVATPHASILRPDSSFIFILLLNIGIHLLVCSEFYESDMCACSLETIIKIVFLILTLSFCLHIILTSKLSLFKNYFFCKRRISVIVFLTTVTSIISLSSSSFVEEEHQTHYFVFVTNLLVIIFELWSLNVTQNILLILTLHRVLRNMNQTGDKWKHLPDLNYYLQNPELDFLKKTLFILSVFLLQMMTYRRSKQILSKIIQFAIFSCIIIQKFAAFPVIIEQICLVLIILNIFVKVKNREEKLFLPLLEFLDPFESSLLILNFMKVAFFYFGNSNSIATIDAGAGFKALNEYNPKHVGALLAIHVYSGPLIVATSCSSKNYIFKFEKLKYFVILFEMLLFCIICTLMRHHLFVWTVFSPKLLYIGMNLIVYS